MTPCLHPPPRTVLFSTVRKPWADVIPCGYEMQHTLRDLVPLKAFLLAGTTVTIVEEKVEFSDRLPSRTPPFQLSIGVSVALFPCQHGLCTFPERSQPAPT